MQDSQFKPVISIHINFAQQAYAPKMQSEDFMKDAYIPYRLVKAVLN